MPQFILKIAKIGFLALLPLLLISNYEMEFPYDIVDVPTGRYYLNSTKIPNGILDGEARYCVAMEKMDDGTHLLTLRLRLHGGQENHSMEFLISQKGKHRELSMGPYRVAGNVEGFIRGFNGLFGFANVEMLGELPFFTEQGGITILQANEDTMQGSLAVTLRNPNGERISISGNFVALPE